jgi:hypothetical protein
MVSFLDGAVAMACLAIAVFFAKFWRDSLDRLFLCLAAAFAVFAVNYTVLGVLPLADERRAYAFVLRLIGFVAILVGILMKNEEMSVHLRLGDDDGR